MLEPKAPNLYLARIDHGLRSHPHNIEGRKLWAFSAEDAAFQIKTELSRYGTSESRLVYVGPVNPNCSCGGSQEYCHCGVSVG